MMQPDVLIREQLLRVLAGRRVIVLCGRADDAGAWQRLLGHERPDRCLTIALDTAAQGHPERRTAGATGHLAWHHNVISGLDGSGWLSRAADAFDQDRKAALLLPDPLDPPAAGTRLRIGRRHAAYRLLEDKTTVDTVWDLIAVPRATSIVADLDTDLAALGSLVDRGSGVVCSMQSAGTSRAGADGVTWWRSGDAPRTSAGQQGGNGRVRLMPLIEGLPVRLHGLVLPTSVVGFRPMEVVALPRTGHGTFLCAGAVSTLDGTYDLAGQTECIGEALRTRFSYVGAFAVDGILTGNGFVPTDLNPRLTSAMEDSTPDLRVLLHAANLLVREGIDPGRELVCFLAEEIFSRRAQYTIYGAATRAHASAASCAGVRWDGGTIVAVRDGESAGHLFLTPSVRGWQLTARLSVDQFPANGPLGPLAVEVFRFCDRVWGTDFGELTAPFGLHSFETSAIRGLTYHGGQATGSSPRGNESASGLPGAELPRHRADLSIMRGPDAAPAVRSGPTTAAQGERVSGTASGAVARQAGGAG